MTNSRSSSFGDRLRRLREAAGLTQERLAERAGLSQNAVAALEVGRRQRPYAHTVQVLADALGIVGPERQALIDAAAGQPKVSAAHSPAVHSLPESLTPLLGRAEDVRSVSGMLCDGARLVTLTGPGGIGKTRLALEGARAVAGQFPHGVVFIALAPLSDADLVVPTIARSLGLVEIASVPLVDALRSHIGDSRTLLVLDNFEQVLEASAQVADLIASCPELRVLATSRAPLRVRGEHEYPLQPLSLPNLSRVPSVEEVAGAAAVQLFVDRAKASSPTFELSQSNSAAVAAICRRLDGLPLAIELAAAKVRVLGPTELLARLDSVLPLLTGGARDLPERQRTMRSTIGWSYDLLDESERSMFRMLGVFLGGWTLEAAEVACGEGAMEGLAGLVEQSLVFALGNETGTGRFRMLEPIRQYALEQLQASKEEAQVRERHATYYLRLAREAVARLRGAEQLVWLHSLEAEHDNLRSALAWSVRNAPSLALRLSAALWPFWYMHSHAEGRWWLEQTLSSGEGLPAVRAEALLGAGMLAWSQADNTSASELYGQALELFREAGDRHGVAGALKGLGLISMEYDSVHARQMLEQSLPLYRQEGDKDGIAICLINIGILVGRTGDYQAALRLYEEGLALYQELGDRWGIAVGLHSMGSCELDQGNEVRAKDLLEQSLATFQEVGHEPGAAAALASLGRIAIRRRDYERAHDYLVQSVATAWKAFDREQAIVSLEGLASLAAGRGRLERAVWLWGAVETMRDRLGIVREASVRAQMEEEVSGLRRKVGDDDFVAWWTAGRAMTPEKAVEYATSTSE